MMSEGVVARFLKAATAEMIRNNQKEIRCPCRRCKLTSLMDPKADMVRDHLLVRGFMDGYRWEGDEDDYEFVHGISTRNKEGGEHHVEVPGHDQDVEDPGHDHDHNVGDHGPDDMEDQDGGPDDEDHEDEDDGPSSMDWVQDPYLQELLLKQTSNARDAAREKAKMDQLEVDAVTPLYEGCRPEDTRLKVTLMALQMKVKHKMTDTSFNDNMSFWHERLPKGNDINLYMGLLKEELATLWDAPANTWDAAAEEYFPMRAALLTTVHDFLGYGYVAGQVVHGFNACVRCMDDTTYRQLDRDPGSSKTVFMGHRRWLRDEDPWRKRKDLFDGQDEPRRRPRTRSGEQIDELLKNWNECPPPGKKRKAPEPLLKPNKQLVRVGCPDRLGATRQCLITRRSGTSEEERQIKRLINGSRRSSSPARFRRGRGVSRGSESLPGFPRCSAGDEGTLSRMLSRLVAVAKLGVAPIVDGEVLAPAGFVLQLEQLRRYGVKLIGAWCSVKGEEQMV
ncbi:hypothetical protein QYE76_044964 [Lolium multiflorum]|uniref:Transposase-associated domain-containing protein n=1 Tax=Lolium multiflorum TaxID=4521 RepID=A0AAD8TM31_LOLMU|nr:hypothetical protein QYE76_044964 [Lolium multiflorum]